MENKLAIFESKEIRKVWHNDEWWFVVEDVVGALTESKNPKQYIKDMKRRDDNFKEGWGQFATPLEYMTK